MGATSAKKKKKMEIIYIVKPVRDNHHINALRNKVRIIIPANNFIETFPFIRLEFEVAVAFVANVVVIYH